MTSTAYNLFASPNQLSVTLGSGDSDVFTYDPSTLRLNTYKFNVGSQSVTGTLGWNANGSLGSLAINDPFSSANTQSCTFTADDLSRISQVNCGTIWGQNFSYDPLGNIQKNQTAGTGTSFTPTYASSPITNRVSSVGGTSATYDANGNSLNDTFRTYTWDADSNPVTIGSVSLTYDAFDRMVEQSVSGTNSEIVYSPAGVKFALMNGTTLTKAFVPLTGGDTAVYNSSGLAYYRHTDHLGSSRFASTPTQTLYSDTAYSPYGEPYASSGAIDNSFTGQNQDTTAGLYDFLFREQDPNQGRWTSPDPAGLAAVDPSDPQTWNRYTYAINAPLSLIDPAGLYVVCIGGFTYDEVDFFVDGLYDSSNYTFIGFPCNGRGRGINDPGGRAAGGGGGGGNSGGGLLSTIKSAVCSALPSGRATSVSVAAGGIGSVSGSVDMVVNYNSGQTSLFATGGGGLGWNGGGSLTATTGLVFGLNDTNNGFSDQFKGANFYAPTPIPGVAAGGSITHGGGVTVVSAGVSGALAGRYGGGASWTNTTKPLNSGKFTGFAPLDYVGYLLRRPCNW